MGPLITAIAIIAVIVVVVLLLLVISGRYQKVGPNEALIISGRGATRTDPVTGRKERIGYRIVKGGGTIVVPVLETAKRLSLEVMTIEVETPRVYTGQGVAVTVDGIAQVKVKSDEISISTAAEQFLSKSVDEIKQVALQTLEGHLRAIVGTLSVEEIYRDRDQFAQRVQEVSATDMANMGLGIISFTIKDINDDQQYLDSLGVARTAEVKRDAAIGQALATRDAKIKSAGAEQEGEQARYAAQTKIASSDKDYQVQKAAYDAEVNRNRACAELAYELQRNKSNQEVKAEEIQIQVIEKERQIKVQEQEVLRRERELEATIRKPAEAEQYRIRTIADGDKYRTVTEAGGEADAAKARGLAQADIVRAQGFAEAEANKARGLAEADVIQAQGFAEAEAMKKKAEAWREYTQAAIIQQLIEAMPKIAAAISEPLAKTDRIVVISTGGADGSGAGASKISQDVANIVAQVPATVEALTGVDIIKTLKNLPQVRESEPVDAASEPINNSGQVQGMSVTVIVGSQWGDEGKGKAIDYFARDADFVARYNGGNNAGHTVVNALGTFKIHLVPSGIFSPHTQCLMGNGMVIDPQVLLDEMKEIRKAGVDFEKRLKIAQRAHLIMPYHRILDGLYEEAKGAGATGTTRRGIGPAFADKISYNGLRWADFIGGTFDERLHVQLELKNKIITALGGDALDYEDVRERYWNYYEQLKAYITELAPIVHKGLTQNKKFLLEQAMGSLLDTDWGVYPYVTASTTLASAATAGLGIPPRKISRIIGVTKAYSTRVGAGPMPTELADDHPTRAQLSETAATTGRARRAGWLDLVPVRFTAQINGTDALFVTKLDTLTGIDELKICVGYKLDGRKVEFAELESAGMTRVEPVYRSFRGWSDNIRGVRKFLDLPKNAQRYVEAIEKIAAVPVRYVGAGPAREAVIKR